MNREEFMSNMAGSMAAKEESMKAAVNEEPMTTEQEEDESIYLIQIPCVSGRVYKVDVRSVDWSNLGTEENMQQIESNESIIRGIAHYLMTEAYFSEDNEKEMNDFDESLTELFTSFGIDPGYNEIKGVEEMDRRLLLLGKCFDAITLISVIAHNVGMHNLATQFQQIFAINSDIENIANINDLTEMDNAVEGIITEDRETYDKGTEILDHIIDTYDDHDVSGLVSE